MIDTNTQKPRIALKGRVLWHLAHPRVFHPIRGDNDTRYPFFRIRQGNIYRNWLNEQRAQKIKRQCVIANRQRKQEIGPFIHECKGQTAVHVKPCGREVFRRLQSNTTLRKAMERGVHLGPERLGRRIAKPRRVIAEVLPDPVKRRTDGQCPGLNGDKSDLRRQPGARLGGLLNAQQENGCRHCHGHRQQSAMPGRQIAKKPIFTHCRSLPRMPPQP
ncbi:hypothetical protein [uncultured Roseobacter sp.]|uniref:hypothetical protein n=1 Tax=uncultured Roseobacter sp. TaxID=114847 RepID=UPI002627B864|nr:hypothetical protein [uncultured Roseobacter sp.]